MIPSFNQIAQKNALPMPKKLLEVFDLSNMQMFPHDEYIEVHFTPTLSTTENEHLKFVPCERYVTVYADSDVYEDSIDEYGFHSSGRTKDYTFSEIFGNQVEIFRKYPVFLTK